MALNKINVNQAEVRMDEGAFNVSMYYAVGNQPATYDTLAEAIAAVPEVYRNGGMTIRFFKTVFGTFNIVRADVASAPSGGILIDSEITNPNGNYYLPEIECADTDVQTELAGVVNAGVTKIFYVEITGDTTTYRRWTVKRNAKDTLFTYQYRNITNEFSLNEGDWVYDGIDEGIYDISLNNMVEVEGVMIPSQYEDLSSALADIPVGKRKGGMNIKFVQSSDHKYVQYRYLGTDVTTNATFTNTDNWAICDDGVYIDNPEFIEVKTDNEGRILWAIKTDGSIYFGAGVPNQIIDYITIKINEYHGDDIIGFLNGLEEEDKTLAKLLNEKVDKVEGRSLIDKDIADRVHYVENPEYMQAETDADGAILGGRKTNGTKVENMPIETPTSVNMTVEDPEMLTADTDIDGGIFGGYDKKGKMHLSFPTNQDDVLKEEIINLHKNDFIDIRSDNFNYYRECIFHDNFKRTVPNAQKPWEIGNNTGERNLNVYDYISLAPANVDDGFRITVNDGKYSLTNVASEVEGFRLIKYLKQRSDIVVEFAMSDALNKYQALVINIDDALNYEMLRFYNYKQGHIIIEYVVVANGNEQANLIPLFKPYTSNAVRFYFIGNLFKIYLDDCQVGSYQLKSNIKNIGIHVESTRNYEYRFFNVFYVSKKKQIKDTTAVIDKGLVDNDLIRYLGQTNRVDAQNEYAYKLVSDVVDFGRCERFEIRYYEGDMDVKSDREECIFKDMDYPLYNNFLFSFDFRLPDDYVLDTLTENIFQTHENVYSVNSPSISLNIQPYSGDNTKPVVFIRIRGNDTPAGRTAYISYDYEIAKELFIPTPGQWYHIDLFANQGYMPEHNPLTVVLVDNKELYRSRIPNAYNVCVPDHNAWGLYKAAWMQHSSNTTTRIAYYDNVKQIC